MSPSRKRIPKAKAKRTPKTKRAVGRRRAKRATPKKAKRAPKTTGAKSQTNWINIRISTRDGTDFEIKSSPQLQRIALQWSYTVSHRHRWSVKEEGEQQRLERVAATFEQLGIEPSGLKTFRDARLIEVEIPYLTEEIGWEARIVPWEYLLSAGTRKQGRTTPLTVIRYLNRQKGPKPQPLATPKRALYVQSAPGPLAETYDFGKESRLLDVLGCQKKLLVNPTLQELQDTCRDYKPGLIHLTGVDIHQASELLEDEIEESPVWEHSDGIVMRSEDGTLQNVDAQNLATVLTAGSPKPRLVVANLFHSASRVCALTVADGASAAIGFQDIFDDELAEIFISELYDACCDKEWNVLAAYYYALRTIRSAHRKMSGTGVVLWTDRSFIMTDPDELEKLARARKEDKEKMIPIKTIAAEPLSNWLRLTVQPTPKLNYSLLHNDSKCLFQEFKLYKEKPGKLTGIEIDVELFTGGDSVPYRTTVQAVEHMTPLEADICVPLISDLLRRVQEPLRTTLFVQVTVQGRRLKRQTFAVTLLPIDEWKDDDLNRLWLPSFVLPRDNAVLNIVRSARKHLMTLTDDRNSGFDGYQSEDPDNVDLQAQAIWAAIVYDYGLGYTNPPPSYTLTGQRLRTPSQILKAGHGTCIDLALLLASCFEYVDIYPVIFLLEGHAFVGYWRSEEDFWNFQTAQGYDMSNIKGPASIGSRSSSWVLPAESYPEVIEQVKKERLYPIEAVGLTDHGSFWQSVDEGHENLRNSDEFHSMVDIKIARDRFVTPLPILEEAYHGNK